MHLIIKYNPIFVIDMCKFPSTGKSILNKSLSSNWLKGLEI